ncbi:uncharacterized protein DS421_2g53490 [Arachis hypogaea]|nr:uncharacterized protein LOC112749936 [Arachis hypogaea]QHO54076.1 uncharacterized protein DS421_2g53490 [Arachis hypogaea]
MAPLLYLLTKPTTPFSPFLIPENNNFSSIISHPPQIKFFTLFIFHTSLFPLQSPIFHLPQLNWKSKRVCFSPDSSDKTTIFLKHGTCVGYDGSGGGGCGGRVLGSKKRMIGCWNFGLLKESSSPVKFLVKLGSKVANAIGIASMRRRSSRKVSSSALARSQSLAGPIDSHRAKAVEDCIEFLHSSSSRERPSSVSEISA